MALIVTVDDQEYIVQLESRGAGFDVLVNGDRSIVTLAGRRKNEIACIIDRKPYVLEYISPEQIEVNGEAYRVSVIDDRVKSVVKRFGKDGHKKDLVLKAPMPGLVIDVLVKNGDQVESGQSLVIIEAMKMQNEMKASRQGRIKNLMVKTGQAVNSGEAVVIIE